MHQLYNLAISIILKYCKIYIMEIRVVRRKGWILMKRIEVWLFRERQEWFHWGSHERGGKDGWPKLGELEGMQEEERKGGWPEVGEEEGMQEKERKGWMAWSGRGGRNARGGKERMDGPKWETRKECKRRKEKDGWSEVGKEEGMQEEERKGWMIQSGKGGKNARARKERMDGPKRERRKECKRRKGNDGWPKWEWRKEWKAKKGNRWMARIEREGKERMDDPKWERRKECKRRKGNDGWPEVGKEEGIKGEERKGWRAQSGGGGRNARGGKEGWMARSGRGGRNARDGKERMDGLKWESRKECKRRKGKDGW
jgi:hypothetical protein